MGVTSVRDPGQRRRRARSTGATRAAAGELLIPHVYPSSLIDGKGPYTAQVANVATSEAEAIALVDKAKANGFIGVKFYGTLDPAWLPAATAEAHKLGLHVHGHIPAGIRPLDAINDGYDEITHINWVMMQAMPDSVIPVSNGIMRFEGPGRYAKDVDLDGPRDQDDRRDDGERSTSTAIRRWSRSRACTCRRTAICRPSYAPFVGTLPPTTERGFRIGGFAVPKDLTRADYRASWAKMVGAARPDAQGRRADRRGHRRRPASSSSASSRSTWRRASRPARGAGGGDHRAGEAGRPGQRNRLDQGRQGRRPGARRRRSRRRGSATCARRAS